MPTRTTKKTTVQPVEVWRCLFCEDARQEVQGGLTIVGAWISAVAVKKFPKNIRCKFILNVTMNELSDEFRLKVIVKTDEERLFRGTMLLPEADFAGQSGHLITPALRLTLKENTTLHIFAGYAKIEDDDLREVLTLPVYEGSISRGSMQDEVSGNISGVPKIPRASKAKSRRLPKSPS